jgi:polyisoprenoid-binding protein YceI
MKNISLFTFFILILSLSLPLYATDWEFDKPHTNIGFRITHLVISDVTGRFKEFDGSVTSNGDDFNNGTIDIVINTASIFTDNEKRDNHLRSGDFFDAKLKVPLSKKLEIRNMKLQENSP